MKPIGMVNEPFLDRMERAMDAISRRQQLVASNVGNIDTPGYKTKDLDFNAALAQAVQAGARSLPLRTTREGQVSAPTVGKGAAQAQAVAGLTVRNDGNNVNIDREMLALTQTRYRYDMVTSVARMRVKQLLSTIEDGSGV